jgi:hypothetical protein
VKHLRSWSLGAVTAILAATSPGAVAQAPEQIPVYRLDLRKVEDIPEGVAALVAGDAGSRPDRFFVDNLYMLKPVSVTVRAVNPGDAINVKLTKEKWESVLREGTTGADNQINFKFRTQGQFQISVTSEKPNTPYKMVVWVGPDIVPKSKPIFVSPSEFKGAGGTPKWLWWAGGGAALVIVGVIVMRMRRKAS